MSRFHSYINSARAIIEAYNGAEPFAAHLKKAFTAQKKFGSTDRREVSHLCYCYYRLGKLVVDMSFEDRLLLGLFICSTTKQVILDQLRPERSAKVTVTIAEKLKFAGISDTTRIFPFTVQLSKSVNKEEFALSHLVQPDLFLRLRPGKEKWVSDRFTETGISYERPFPDIIVLPNGTKLEEIIRLNRDAVVQDYNSQMATRLLDFAAPAVGDHVWDCCAASGGKAIQLVDMYPGIQLTVSDIRESIIANLRTRFDEAGIKRYKSFVADVGAGKFSLDQPSDIILADVPCSGSGTWGRTPEQLSFFDEAKLSHYSLLQRNIVTNAVPHLREGGHLLYVTCSVFTDENENNISYFLETIPGLELVKMELLAGYDKKADSMFAALLQKTSK